MPFKKPRTLLGEEMERDIESIGAVSRVRVSDLGRAGFYLWTYIACTRSFQSAYVPVVYMTSTAHNLVPDRMESSR